MNRCWIKSSLTFGVLALCLTVSGTAGAQESRAYRGATAYHLVSSLDDTLDVRSGGVVHRFQVGGGCWLHDLILAKLEYVYPFNDGFTADESQVSGVDIWRDPEFNGVLMEILLTF